MKNLQRFAMQQANEANIEPEGLLRVAGETVEKELVPDPINIHFYRNEVPPYVEAEMERLYENTFSSIGLLKINGCLDERTHTYVVTSLGQVTTILLFRLEERTVKVLNEVIKIDQSDIDRFAAFVFQTFASANAIVFHAIQTHIQYLQFPYQCFNCLEDIVLDLPETEEAYHAILGKNTRRKIKRYTDKLTREFPSFQFSFYQKKDACEQHVRRIIELNHARMAVKNKPSMLDEQESARIISLVKTSGLVSVVTINGQVCAGAICFQTGSNCFLSILAHDPDYDAYWLGILCCYLTICECIARFGKRFHFLWGRYDFKYMLRAKTIDLDHVVVYRSRSQMLLNTQLVVKTAVAGAVRKINLLLHDTKQEGTYWGRFALGVLRQWRKVKWGLSRLLGERKRGPS
jgi:hypothetical protein